MSADQLRPGAGYGLQAICPLPDCERPLHFVRESAVPVYLAFTAAELADPESAHTSSWAIECEGGHKVLVPVDTAEDYYTFGENRFEPDGPTDVDRLRRLLGIEVTS